MAPVVRAVPVQQPRGSKSPRGDGEPVALADALRPPLSALSGALTFVQFIFIFVLKVHHVGWVPLVQNGMKAVRLGEQLHTLRLRALQLGVALDLLDRLFERGDLLREGVRVGLGDVFFEIVAMANSMRPFWISAAVLTVLIVPAQV